MKKILTALAVLAISPALANPPLAAATASAEPTATLPSLAPAPDDALSLASADAVTDGRALLLVDPEAIAAMEARQRRIQAMNDELAELSLRRQLQDMRREFSGSGALPVSLPRLVGITLRRGVLVAEFAGQMGVFTALVGDAIAPGWTIRGIGEREVTLTGLEDGRASRYTLNVGVDQPVQARTR